MARKKKNASSSPLDTPQNRTEKYLAKLAKLTEGSEDLGYPQNRLERFLAKLAGYTDEFPEGEYSRLERYLKLIETGGGGGGSGVPASDVNFFDYDGTIVASYTAADFANLSALPDNPTHDGLTAQGWNWTLADAKTYVASYGKLNIGQMYITGDGKTRIYIKLEEGRLAPYLGLAINGTATVEWGDGQTSTVTGTNIARVVNTQHTYTSAGEYVIKIAVDGMAQLMGTPSYGSQVIWKNNTTAIQNRVYQNSIQKIEIGANTSIGVYAFAQCYSIRSIAIPNTVTSILGYTFNNCYSLVSIVIPSSVRNVEAHTFHGCYSLIAVAIPSSITSFSNYTFKSCYSLGSVAIPANLTDIGTYVFEDCYSLSFISIPNRVEIIDAYAFSQCAGLSAIKFTSELPPDDVETGAWNSLPADCIIYVPRGSLTAYTSAAGYPSSSVYTYVEYDP